MRGRIILQGNKKGVPCHIFCLTMSLSFMIVTTSILHAQPLAAGKEKFLGGATSENLSRYFERYWNQVTPGNAGKWGSVEMVRGSYNWTNLDKIYNYAIKRNFLYKHHTLIWGQQQPGWINSLSDSAQLVAIESWIDTVGARYPQMSFVDVVNEPLHAPPAYKRALGGDGASGWEWVITAFQLARKYCAPSVQLHLNEYNILHSNSNTDTYIQLITLLKDRGLIDGVCIQGHYFEFRSDINATNQYIYDINTIKSNLNRLAALGLPIYISEFDIDEPNDADQLAQYKIYFPIFWCHPAVKGITHWGSIQGDVWTAHPNTYLILTNGTERPALQWLRTFIQLPCPPIIISPNTTGGEPLNAVLKWHASKTANAYHLQLATSVSFAVVVVDTTVADTLVQLAPLLPNRRYFWRVSAINDHGESNFSDTAIFMTGEQLTVNQSEHAIKEFKLLQNYPNPFNATTTISFLLPKTSKVRLLLLNVRGQEVRLLVEGIFPAGQHDMSVHGGDLPSGIYICRMEAGDYIGQLKWVVVK